MIYLILSILTLLTSCNGLFYYSSKPVEKGKININLSIGNLLIENYETNYILIPKQISNSNIIFNSNVMLISNTLWNENLYNIFNIGFRYGLDNNLDLGVRLWNIGAIVDIKYMFLENPTFRAAFDLETGYCGIFEIGFTYTHDIIIYDWLIFYFNFKWRFYSTNNINNNYYYDFTNYPITGIIFSPNFGLYIKLLNNFNTAIEVGGVKSWDNYFYKFIGGITFIFNLF